MKIASKISLMVASLTVSGAAVFCWGFKMPLPNANTCYFRGQSYSDGTESSLNTICTYKCSNGVWYCQSCSGRSCDTQPRTVTANTCMFQSEAYSEGSPSSLNSINFYICHEGSWVKQ